MKPILGLYSPNIQTMSGQIHLGPWIQCQILDFGWLSPAYFSKNIILG